MLLSILIPLFQSLVPGSFLLCLFVICALLWLIVNFIKSLLQVFDLCNEMLVYLLEISPHLNELSFRIHVIGFRHGESVVKFVSLTHNNIVWSREFFFHIFEVSSSIFDLLENSCISTWSGVIQLFEVSSCWSLNFSWSLRILKII